MEAHRLRAFFVLFALIPFEPTVAERLPTETELHAVYCGAIVNSQLGVATRAIHEITELLNSDDRIESLRQKDPAAPERARQALGELKDHADMLSDALHRIQLFIIPRLAEIDPISVTTALQRASKDNTTLLAGGEQCAAQCTASRDKNCFAKCVTAVAGKVRARLEQCRDPIWLPY